MIVEPKIVEGWKIVIVFSLSRNWNGEPGTTVGGCDRREGEDCNAQTEDARHANNTDWREELP